MAVPKQRHNRSRTRRRRGGHDKQKAISFVKCSNCEKEIEAHKLCAFCGSFKGREVVNMTAKVKKVEKSDK